MSDPRKTKPPSLDQVFAAWEAEREVQAEQRNAIYVSAPITTGAIFVEWRQAIGGDLEEGSPEYARAHRSDVILPNTQRLSRFLELLRWKHIGLLIDPSSLDVPGWEQNDYHRFWLKVIERHVRRMILMDGWEYSTGCSLEFQRAQELELDCVDEQLRPLTSDDGLRLLKASIERIGALGLATDRLAKVARELEAVRRPVVKTERRLYKDDVLDHLAHTANVAQFVSFAPHTLAQRRSRVVGLEPNHRFASVEEAVDVMLVKSPEKLLNVRSFDPERPEGNPFRKRLDTRDAVLANLHELGVERGLYTIVNETIDEHDGGVSGVCHRGLLDFAPDTTPRCVEDPNCERCTLPFELGMGLFCLVYGFEPDLRGREGARVEFSIHPEPRGWLRQHTIIWQHEQRPGPDIHAATHWPNAFSRFLGDKVFGLALAAVSGFDVPRTLVVSNRLFPWTFGRPTGTGRLWTRTAPAIKVPGYYPSAPGWTDPRAVLNDPWVLDPSSRPLEPSNAAPVVAVIAQEEVQPVYSGRATHESGAERPIQGVRGVGTGFMLGDSCAEDLPADVVERVRHLYDAISGRFGRVEIEWVFDGATAWVVQMNAPRVRGAEALSADGVEWKEFCFKPGAIEEFRHEAAKLSGTKGGLVVVGNVSPLSHLGEIADLFQVPVRFVPS